MTFVWVYVCVCVRVCVHACAYPCISSSQSMGTGIWIIFAPTAFTDDIKSARLPYCSRAFQHSTKYALLGPDWPSASNIIIITKTYLYSLFQSMPYYSNSTRVATLIRCKSPYNTKTALQKIIQSIQRLTHTKDQRLPFTLALLHNPNQVNIDHRTKLYNHTIIIHDKHPYSVSVKGPQEAVFCRPRCLGTKG